MDTIYTTGEYLKLTRTWHAQDSFWKAGQINKIITRNGLHPQTISEIGCGAGGILSELSKKENLENVLFSGYDISPQAIELAKQKESENVRFYEEDLLGRPPENVFDVLLVIDVFEHAPDFMGFIDKCRSRAEYKIFHIPLDIDGLSVVRNTFLRVRYSLGHLHYFTADSAIAALRDTGHEIVDYFYTPKAFGRFRQKPSLRNALHAIPIWLFSGISVPLTARILGGYCLLVLTK